MKDALFIIFLLGPSLAGAQVPEKDAAAAAQLFDHNKVNGSAPEAPSIREALKLARPVAPVTAGRRALDCSEPPEPPSEEGPKSKFGRDTGKAVGMLSGAIAGAGWAVHTVAANVSYLTNPNAPYNEGAGFALIGLLFIVAPVLFLLGLGIGGTGGFMIGGHLGAWLARKIGKEPGPPFLTWAGVLEKLGGFLGLVLGGGAVLTVSFMAASLLSLVGGAEGLMQLVALASLVGTVIGAVKGSRLIGKIGRLLGQKLDGK